MKPKARKYRLRRGGALADGVDPAVAAAGVGKNAPANANAPRVTGGGDPAPQTPQPEMPAKAHTGEVSSADDVSSEQAIAAIRREGLTGRQLRMARRVAQKHGLAPTSDFDAVRLLRAQGVDPFRRANMLELVVPQGEEGSGKPVQLPQTVPQPRPPAIPQSEPRAPEERAGEIYKIQRDIARRRRRKMLLLVARLAVFVFLPTLVALWYYGGVATPLYATNSEFVIKKQETQGAAGISGLFQGTGIATQQDSTTVQSFLQSREAMQRLDADHGFKSHFSEAEIDVIQRLDPGATDEDAYALYKRTVTIGYDPTEGILKMEVIAANPETSEAFSKALIGYAEERVDGLTERVRQDQMRGAIESYEEAEANVRVAQERVLELQERLGVLNPETEVATLMQQIATFETELRSKQLELDQLLANARPNQARVSGVRGDIERLQALIGELRGSMTESSEGSASLARISGELRIAEGELLMRQTLLQQALQQREGARITASSQALYLETSVTPVAPDEPTYPKVFENTLLAFFVFAGIYLMVSLTASVLREQVSG